MDLNNVMWENRRAELFKYVMGSSRLQTDLQATVAKLPFHDSPFSSNAFHLMIVDGV
jgi:hypothetical protein